MRHFQLSLIALLILILAVVPLAGCMPVSEDEAWKDKYETLQIEDTILKAELQSVKSDIDYVKATSKTLRNDYDTLKTNYDRLQADHVTLEATSKKLQTTYNTLQADYNKTKANYDSLKRDSILYDTTLAAQKAAYDSLKANYDSLKTLYNELVNWVNTVMSSSTTLPTPTPTYQTWIDKYQATYGELPIVPDWLDDLIPELKAGDRIRKGVTLIRAGAQYWARRSPTEKDMIWELYAWLGYYPVAYLGQTDKRSRPPDPSSPIYP